MANVDIDRFTTEVLGVVKHAVGSAAEPLEKRIARLEKHLGLTEETPSFKSARKPND